MLNFKTTLEKTEGNISTFTLSPLERGFGHTIGNVLRRVLLSSLEGSAIASVKITGVSHMFSTVPGISEDVIEIVLNLKKVRLNIFSDKPIKLTLKASGKGELKASDIDTQGLAEIINPDLHIASLNSATAKLTIEMVADKGVGYIMADEKKSDEIGVLPIDSIYSPIIEVNYKVEPTRVGRSSNYDLLTLNITTDGTVSSQDALDKSARILSSYFKQIFDPTLDIEIIPDTTTANPSLKLSVEELDLPVRITNALKAIEIDTVEKLITVPKGQLLKAKNLGVQSVNLVSQKLQERGLGLSEA